MRNVCPRLRPVSLTELTSGNRADEGYRLTYGGYDFLACRTFAKRDTIYSVGNQIGTGKESGALSHRSPTPPAREYREGNGSHAGMCLRACRYLRRRRRRRCADGHEDPPVRPGICLVPLGRKQIYLLDDL